jgi:hypothetical protein
VVEPLTVSIIINWVTPLKGYSASDDIGPAPRVEQLTKDDFKYPQEKSGTKLKLKITGSPMIYTDTQGNYRGDVINGFYQKLPDKVNGKRAYARIPMRGEVVVSAVRCFVFGQVSMLRGCVRTQYLLA